MEGSLKRLGSPRLTSSPVEHLPARRPGRHALRGRHVVLEPLDLARDASDLHVTGSAGGPELWTFLPYGPFADPAALAAAYAPLGGGDDPLFLTVFSTGVPSGIASFLNVVPVHGTIELGHIWFGPALQRTPAATEALLLLLEEAFALGNRRVEWKCNAANGRSRRAAERLGFTYEGTFRQHMVVKGRNRDTAWFSLLDREWPIARSALRRWLDPANFDASGEQRETLETLRASETQ